MIYDISRTFCALILKVIFGLKVCGREYVPKSGGFILASNHVSFLDPPALGVACPRKLNYMARHDLFSHGLSSWWLYSVGCFPVKRDSADFSSLKEAMQRIRNGAGLLLFPEGRRQRTANLSAKPQPGIGFLAAKLNVPVVPAFISGTEKALPKGAKFVRPAKIFVNFGKQIHLERGMPYQAFAELVMENIRHLSC